jgi:hypothetical protein
VSDIFREVDEEVRRAHLQKLWERYGIYIVAACVLLLVAVGAWRANEWFETKKAAEAGVAFEAAVALADQGKHREAEEAFSKLAAEGTATYRMLAKFREAAAQTRRDPGLSIATYDRLGADRDLPPALQDLAALRAGTILVDTAPFDEIKRRLEPLTAPGRTFRHSARVMLALAAWRAQDYTAMRHWSDMVLADIETPTGARGQIQMLMALSDSDKKS